MMYGYPNILQNSKDTHSYSLDGKVSDTGSAKLFVTIYNKLGSLDIEEKDMLDGFSGSGFYLTTGKSVKLCGIETNVLTKSVPYNAVCGVNVDTILSLLCSMGIDTNTLLLDDSISEIVKQSELYMSHIVPINNLVKNIVK